jgi:hypothetical protein
MADNLWQQNCLPTKVDSSLPQPLKLVCGLNGYHPTSPIRQVGIRSGETGPLAVTEDAIAVGKLHWDATHWGMADLASTILVEDDPTELQRKM